MLRAFLLCSLIWAASTALARQAKLDSLTVGTQTYSNVTVIGANATDLYFTHAKGVANVKLKYLNKDLQKQFHYDAATATAAEKLQSKLDSLYQADLLATMAAKAVAARNATQDSSHGSSEKSLSDAISDKSPLGKAGPELKVDKWLGHEPALKGKFVLLSFWAPWSVPSRKAISDLNAMQKKFSSHLVVVGIAAGTDAGEVSTVEPKLEYASALDASGKLTAAAGVTSVPTVLLLNPAGAVLYAGHPAAVTEKFLQGITEPTP